MVSCDGLERNDRTGGEPLCRSRIGRSEDRVIVELAIGDLRRRLTVTRSADQPITNRQTAAKEAPAMQVGLYSITYLGVWYRGPALTLDQLIDRARQYGYAGIEIDGKRPHGNPLDLPQSRCLDVRRRAEEAGVEIYAVAANNDFSSPIPEHRESQLAHVRDLIRMTADLGAPALRVFAAWPGVTLSPNGGRYDVARRVWAVAHEECTAEQSWEWCRSALVESARWAGEHGVTLALQNHPPVIDSGEDMLRMIREVGSPSLKACLDAPLAKQQRVVDMRQAVREVGSLQVLSHFGGEYERDPDGRVRGYVRRSDGLTPEDFYADFVRGLVEIGYDGYIGYELCHPLPKVDGETVGIEFAEKNARLAAEYMRALIAEVRPTATIVGTGGLTFRGGD
jgi:sugar phosphate isomerase/epimerase